MAPIWLIRIRLHVIPAAHTATYQSDDIRDNQMWVTRRGRVDNSQNRAHWVNLTSIFVWC